MATDWKSVLRSITDIWDKQIRYAAAVKEKRFGESARLMWGYLGKSFSELYRGQNQFKIEDWAFLFPDADDPHYQPRINLSAQFVQVMVPYILSKVPNRTVSPSRPALPADLMMLPQQLMQATMIAQQTGQPPPQLSPLLGTVVGLLSQAIPRHEETRLIDQIRAWLMQWFLNWTPGEYGLVQEQRRVLPEALVKGRGIVWHEMHRGPTGLPESDGIPASFQGTVDYQFVDGNCRQFRDAGFVARYSEAPFWELAEEYGVDEQMLRDHVQRREQQMLSPDLPVRFADDDSAGSICPYLRVYSRTGIGQKFADAADDLKEFEAKLESVGKHIYLIFVPGVDYPINLPPDIAEIATQTELEQRLSWPIPFYDEINNPFPCSNLDFLPSSDSPWPSSPLEAAAPLQVFIDHLWAYLMCRVRREARSLVLIKAGVDLALDEALEYGLDLEIVKCSGEIGEEFVRILDLPGLNPDLWKIEPLAKATFQEMTGMLPLMQGNVGETQPRSATEMSVREQRVSSRPDDYADALEAFNSAVVAKEGAAARMHTDPSVVAPLFGEIVGEGFDPHAEEADLTKLGPLSQLWSLLVNTKNPAEAVADVSYSIEAGSGRRKNKQKQIGDLQTLSQTVSPLLAQAWTGTGDPSQLNAFLDIVDEALDMGGKLKRLYFPPLQLQPAQPSQPPPEKG